MTALPERLYTLDTNLFIDALRASRVEPLLRFHRAFAPFEHLSSIVVHELLAGTRTDAARRELERDVVEPFRETARIFAPTQNAWERSGTALARLAVSEGAPTGSYSRAFNNDVLLAASCREAGITLVTRNIRDFQRIATVLPFSFTPPWPNPSS